MHAPPTPSPGDPNPKKRPAGANSVANRRLFERHAVDYPCRVTELDHLGNPSTTWEGRLVDVSRGGIGLRSRRMVYAGRHIFIEVESAAGDTKLLFGVVRQSRYSEGEGYAIGVEFRAVPQTSAIRNWLSQRGLHD